MRVGLYNRWVRTAGGGEKHSLAIAEILASSADVDLLTHERIDLAPLAERLRLGLDAVKVRYVDATADAVTCASGDYDLFINASYMSLLPSRARRSALLVFFPNQLFPSRWSLRKASLVEGLSKFLAFPRYGDGFHAPEQVGRRLARWTTGTGRLRIEVPRCRQPWVEIVLSAPVDGVPVTVRCENDRESELHRIVARRDLATYRMPLRSMGHGEIRVEIQSPEFDLASLTRNDRRTVGIYVLDVHVPGLRHRLYRTLFERVFTARRHAFEQQETRYAAWRAVRTYDAIWANSKFTQRWVKHYWGRTADVLYPPVDVELLQPRDKRPIILSVGRFFCEGHCKRQDILVEAARDLFSRVGKPWRLVLVGGIGGSTADHEYYDRIRKSAEGLPVTIVPDAPLEVLTDLYSHASLYWHAAGFSQDPRRDPATLEHFGITTVEAMAAGCVPLVYDSGGQAEIVQSGRNGYRWRTTSQLVALSRSLITDGRRMASMSAAAATSACRFTRRRFDMRAKGLVGRLAPP